MTPTDQAVRLKTVRTGPGSSTPIVLLHSAALDLTYWDQQIRALGTDHAVVALDLPGHGESTGGPEVWEGDGVFDAVAATIDGLDADGVHIVGLSVGGVLAQELALRNPEHVRSLTLIDTGPGFSAVAQTAMRARAATVRSEGIAAALPGLIGHWFLPSTVAARPDLMARVTRTVLAQEPMVHAAMWEYIASVDLATQIHAITCPTLVLVGEHDQSSPVQTSRGLHDSIPGSRMIVVPNAAHLSVLEQPQLVSRLIAEHVSSVI
jgi:3-oxoadipate enol-lactonase